jgi:hypothetical protein
MKNKEFDCVEMKHRAAEEIGDKLKHFITDDPLPTATQQRRLTPFVTG